MIQELRPEALRRVVDPTTLGFQSTEEVTPREGIIGQKRALSALRFGLGIQDGGFNVYVAGPPGIGKMTAVQSFLDGIARLRPAARDWCYVHNFEDPYRPRALALPAGMGRRLQRDLQHVVEHVRREIPKAFESEDYGAKRDAIVKELDKSRSEILDGLKEEVGKAGFSLESTPFGIAIIPILGGRPLSDEEFSDLPAPAREDLDRRREHLQAKLKASMRQIRDLARSAQERLHELGGRIALYLVDGLMEDLSEAYRELPEVLAYLKAVQQDIVDNIDPFRTESPGEEAAGVGAALLARRFREAPFRKYQVNVLVDNSRQEGAPVVVELSPSYGNLFGRVEKETELGAIVTDFTMIKPGSLHRANGGFLVLPVEDVLRDYWCWDGLKRALRAGEIQIEEVAERMGLASTRSLRPQPVPLDLKVLLVGRPIWYHLLHAYDESFGELFKVTADFDTRMGRSAEELGEFVSFLCSFCTKESMRPLDAEAAAKLVEHASRLAEDQEKLTTRLGPLADVIREAHYWAVQEDAPRILAAHVRKAIDEKLFRSGLVQERIQEMIERGFLLIATGGKAVGQVNGLSVIALGEVMFGRPSRITASVTPGRGGVVDIEREVELGGPIHSKGVMILSGYLAQRFARERPLTLAARLVFEQSYEGVEGDSASSTELYALLSALSDLPLAQGVAVTGSVNQHGEVQAIGGVNEKIEGFFDVCCIQGLSGTQGVMIPRSNAPNLMLREDVVEAVRSGTFHVWTVDTIDDGIELLTGTPAGARDAEGRFPDGSVGALVEQTLRRYAERLRELAAPGAAGGTGVGGGAGGAATPA
jgi:lon-related putative ATP-dependent protease